MSGGDITPTQTLPPRGGGLPLFDAYLVLDWSAASTPKTGADSVWFCLIERDRAPVVANPPTRDAAMAAIADHLSDLLARGKRVLVGADFNFGYPAGFAARLDARRPDWRGVWSRLSALVEDGPDNANNRFAVAAALNRAAGAGFWGRPAGRDVADLPARRPESDLPEWRLCERRAPGTQPAWKLFGAGSVGGQTLLGIARLDALRRHPWLDGQVRVWPFETGLHPPADGRIVLAEMWPSLISVPVAQGEIRDARQVAALARHVADLDAAGRLEPLFSGDPTLTPAERAVVEAEEGWILGVGAAPSIDDYIRDPDAIYAASWAAIRAELDLSPFPAALHPLVLRVVHACGMTDVAADLLAAPGAAEAGMAALRAGAPVLVDAEMVAHGIIRRRLPAANAVICTLNAPEVPDLAKRLGTTRSAAAVELWRDRLDGAVVAIGNAPTALFHLLQMVAAGGPRPALVLGFAVGFVGAAESKAALAANALGIPYVTLRGRRGGSAMAAAAVNALGTDVSVTPAQAGVQGQPRPAPDQTAPGFPLSRE